MWRQSNNSLNAHLKTVKHLISILWLEEVAEI